MGLFDFLKDTIGIDPGSHHLRITKNGALVFNERSQVSFGKETGIVTGIGDSIQLGDAHFTKSPIDGTVADFLGFERLLSGALKKGQNSSFFIPRSYKMFFCIPLGATEIDRRAYRDSAEHAGATEVYMIYQSFCAAIGLNILSEQKHFLIVDFGSSKIEMSVFVNGLPVSDRVIPMGTSKIFGLVRNVLKRNYKLSVFDVEIHSMLSDLRRINGGIRVQHVTVHVDEIHSLLDHFFSIVNDALMEVIEGVSSHSEIGKALSNGIYFTGGGSTIDILREKITIDNRIKTTVSKTPLLDNINGLEKVIAEREGYTRYLIT